MSDASQPPKQSSCQCLSTRLGAQSQPPALLPGLRLSCHRGNVNFRVVSTLLDALGQPVPRRKLSRSTVEWGNFRQTRQSARVKLKWWRCFQCLACVFGTLGLQGFVVCRRKQYVAMRIQSIKHDSLYIGSATRFATKFESFTGDYCRELCILPELRQVC